MLKKLYLIYTSLALIQSTAFGAVYFVAREEGNASDANPGTLASPFLTISHAASIMDSGDLCYIKTGVYRETLKPAHSGTSEKPITFRAYGGDIVTITGLDLITGWSVYSGNVFSKSFSSGSIAIKQLFLDKIPMNEARWPDLQPTGTPYETTPNHFKPPLAKVISASSKDTLGTTYQCFETSDLPNSNTQNYWKGAIVSGRFGVMSTARTDTIHFQIGNKLCAKFDNTHSDYFPKDIDRILYPDTNRFFLVHGLKGMSMFKEWAYDSTAGGGVLYFWAIPGTSPEEHLMEGQTRRWAVNLEKLSHINVSGINIFSGGVNLDSSSNCSLTETQVLYSTPFFLPKPGFPSGDHNMEKLGFVVGGESNTIRNCRVFESWANGITINGTGHSVNGCLISNSNLLAGEFAPIDLNGANTKVANNTISGAGRSGLIHFDLDSNEISFNDISDYGKSVFDLGGIYSFGANGHGTRISNNWVHHPFTDPDTSIRHGANGIYVDENSENYIISNNVVVGVSEASIRLNAPVSNIKIVNNTFWFGWGFRSRPITGSVSYDSSWYLNILFKNNILLNGFSKNNGSNWSSPSFINSNNNFGEGGDGLFESVENMDFRIKSSASTLIDEGVQVSGITNALTTPDIGAYEFGESWKPRNSTFFRGYYELGWKEPEMISFEYKNIQLEDVDLDFILWGN